MSRRGQLIPIDLAQHWVPLVGAGETPALYRVITLTLDTGEVLPVLVEAATWVPARIATRWAVRRRRLECMDNTLAADLRGLGLLYTWSARNGIALDDLLEKGELLSRRQLDALIVSMRVRINVNGDPVTRSLGGVGMQAVAMRTFLDWACDPQNVGGCQHKSINKIAEQRQMLVDVFANVAHYAGQSQRISPLKPDEWKRIQAVAGPIRSPEGRVLQPITFSEENPFWDQNRLRNWVMILIAIEDGLRRGELLKLRLDDVPKPTDPGLKIRRRPHDKYDSRRTKPRVKTVERTLEFAGEARICLRPYLTSPYPLGRPSGKTPYLFVSTSGHELSISAADNILEVLGQHAGVPDLSWHTFRHSWAESVADALLDRYPDEVALQYLRALGGWKTNSMQPFHYIQCAVGKRANDFLRERNDRLYTGPEVA